MLLDPLVLLFSILIPNFLGIGWIFLHGFYLKKRRFTLVSFLPFLISFIGCLVTSLLFITKVYAIEPDSHHRVLFVFGNYEIKTPDGQKVKIERAHGHATYIINSTGLTLELYGVRYGDYNYENLRAPAKIPPHSFFLSNVCPDVFPDQEIPKSVTIDSNAGRGKILNVLQFEDGNVLAY